MSEQIREQVSAFLDGELPNSESELLLKRLTRDPELRESFGRYALIGEAVRGASRAYLTQGFAGRVNLAIDGEVTPSVPATHGRAPRWWRPLAGVAVAAGVAAVAVVALQQRAVSPGLRPALITAQSVSSAPRSALVQTAALQASHEPLSYTVPTTSAAGPTAMPPARLTNYVFAHSKYSSGLDQQGVLADMLIEAEEQQQPAANDAAAPVAP
jgi:sigma-E factor negative regulatory protein RseA